jgi:hypothetical protein
MMDKRNFEEIMADAINHVDAAIREVIQKLIDDSTQSKELQWCYDELLEQYNQQRSEEGIFGLEEWSDIEEAFNGEFDRSEDERDN